MTAPSAMIPPAFVAVIQMERWGIAHSMYRPSASVMVLTITRSGIHSPVILAPATGFRPCGVDSKTTPETIGEVTFSPGGIPAAAAASGTSWMSRVVSAATVAAATQGWTYPGLSANRTANTPAGATNRYQPSASDALWAP